MSPPSLLSSVLVLLGFLGPVIYILNATFRLWRPTHQKNGPKLPPGPPALPIIGNLHLLGKLPHRDLHFLAKKYGPIMSLRLGYVPTIVVSSPAAAELFLKTHDTIFCSRPRVQGSLIMSYGTKGLAFTAYGPYWRNVRKLCTVHLLSASKIERFAPMRREETTLVVNSLKNAAAKGEAVDVSALVEDVIGKMICRMLFGSSFSTEFDLKPVIKEGMTLVGAFNLSDYLPWLAPLDLQGLTRRMKAYSRTMDEVLEKMIDEHEKDGQWQQKELHRDFIDVMLSLINQPTNTNNDQIDRANMKAIIIDMISGGFDTSATAIEWTFSELLRHPRVMESAQQELQKVVGMDRMVEEADLSKLPYLEMVIKESLRLHPVAPLSVPHESMEDITINGYHIPKKSRIIVNSWAIGRDPDVWSDNVGEFVPERFQDINIDVRGQDFQLIPFGSGRRGCPGMQLGLTTVRLVLAQLLHCFRWNLPDGMQPIDLDMNEVFGLSMPRASHVLASPTYRLLC
ncbi:hypothetical protein Tsubulata_040034 [Turnera subulata]|uniref:Cytochrome P450 n=1 Tax=Turnera subulata TaxID=218843 RepID=A0A9Q0JC42_9ROSI|nr:hypothetical protein Tsubulata_040034 [Turnera subulata]